MITVFLLAFIIMAKFDEEEKSGETRVVCFVFSCSCFVFVFLVKRFQSVFLIFIIFLTAITIAVIKTFVFLFSTLWFLFVCFCVVTQNFETGDESRSAEQKSFFLSAAGIIKSTDGRGLETYMVAPPTFFL